MRAPLLLTRLTLTLALVAAGAAASAQEAWPARPITLIVPFAAGSGTDIGARLLARDLSASLGAATVVVDNRPGANGAIGAQAAARARPDGHTLMIGNATSHAANFAFFAGKLGYGPASFDIVGTLGASPIGLYVAPGAPWRTLAELVADARRNPGKFSCGSGNATTQVACEVFRKQAGIEAVTVPYKGNPQSLTDVAGGQLSYAFADASVAAGFLEGRKIRALAVAAAQRNPVAPEVPTFVELGYAGFEVTGWSAVFAPAGVPRAIVERLNAAVRKSTESPESVQSRQRAGSIALPYDVEASRRFLQAEIARWARFVEVSGVKPEQ